LSECFDPCVGSRVDTLSPAAPFSPWVVSLSRPVFFSGYALRLPCHRFRFNFRCPRAGHANFHPLVLDSFGPFFCSCRKRLSRTVLMLLRRLLVRAFLRPSLLPFLTPSLQLIFFPLCVRRSLRVKGPIEASPPLFQPRYRFPI